VRRKDIRPAIIAMLADHRNDVMSFDAANGMSVPDRCRQNLDGDERQPAPIVA
jgi:hypothetical protein